MGYDRAITMFSPDGRLLQVEYAKKTVKQGSTAAGMVCSDGVVLVTDKRVVDKLMVADSVEKIFVIDDHVLSTASGILSDARVLIERAQVLSQQHKVTYGENIDILSVVKDICNLKQICTQSGGLRPFGVSLLVGGIDRKGPHLFETDPTGIYFEYKATAIGENEADIEELLNKEYSEKLKVEEGLKLLVKALSNALGKDFSIDRVDAAFMKSGDKVMTTVDKQKIDKIFKELKKK